MTERKHLKSRVRARMAHTGERYATARLHVVGETIATVDPSTSAPAAAGVNPATSALVALLAPAGLSIPEPLALVIGGGIGMGVFQFHYAKEGVSSFFIAGRHRWEDDAGFLMDALRRSGLEPIVNETGSARAAERQLRTALSEGGPAVAWVDAAELETRALPGGYRGGAYHVVVIRALDDERSVAVIDDLADESFQIPMETLARARARIAKDRNRLLWVAPGASASPTVLPDAIRGGLRATVAGLRAPRSRAFGLEALTDWSRRLQGGGKDGWDAVFPAGERLWVGLEAIRLHIAHYGSGGGLLRPAFAAGLRLAADTIDTPALRAVAQVYDELGRAWSDLAAAALPSGVPAFRQTARLQDLRAARYRAAGPAALEDLHAAWQATTKVRAEVAGCWPLDEDLTDALKHDLADRVQALAAAERDALAALGDVIDGFWPATAIAT